MYVHGDSLRSGESANILNSTIFGFGNFVMAHLKLNNSDMHWCFSASMDSGYVKAHTANAQASNDTYIRKNEKNPSFFWKVYQVYVA